jgi:hypothetical protein
MSFSHVVHVLLQEKCLDYFDQTFLKSTNKDNYVLCKNAYVPPVSLHEQLYIILYKWLYVNARKNHHLSLYLHYDPVYTVIDDTSVAVVESMPTDPGVFIHTKYQNLVVANSLSTVKERLHEDICNIKSFDDILFTFMSSNIAVCDLVTEVHTLFKNNAKNIKISIFLK